MLRTLHQQHEDTLCHCRSEMEALYNDAQATGSVIILTAPNSLILDAMGNTEFLDIVAFTIYSSSLSPLDQKHTLATSITEPHHLYRGGA